MLNPKFEYPLFLSRGFPPREGEQRLHDQLDEAVARAAVELQRLVEAVEGREGGECALLQEVIAAGAANRDDASAGGAQSGN